MGLSVLDLAIEHRSAASETPELAGHRPETMQITRKLWVWFSGVTAGDLMAVGN